MEISGQAYQIDKKIINKRYLAHITDVKTKREPNLDLDYLLVTVKVKIKIIHKNKKRVWEESME